MTPPLISPNEPERLAALERYRILDTSPDESFDSLVRLAAMICGVPMAMITLVDRSRGWFKSRVGLGLDQTTRLDSFCAHAINEQDDVVVVPDTLKDPRFADNPFVTGEPHIRFYAGAQLLTPEGLRLGALCIMDRAPRELTPEQLTSLRALAGQVMVQLELRREIAERSVTEEKLNLSEKLFQTLADSAPIGIYRTDDAGFCLYTNRRWQEISGLSGVSSLGYAWMEAINADDREAVADHWFHCVGRKKEWSAVYRVGGGQGGERIVESRAAHVEELGGWVGTVIDVTDAHHAEEALRNKEATLQRVIEGTNDGFWDWNVVTGEAQFSERLASMLGYKVEELVPHVSTWTALIHDDDRSRVMEELDKHMQAITPQYETEHRLRCANGDWLWILDRGRVVARDVDGHPLQMAGSVTDISVRRKAERELDRFFQVSLDLLCIVGIDGRFKRVNPAFTTVLGYTPAELLGKPVLELIHPADRRLAVEQLERLRRGLRTLRVESRCVCRDGSTKWLSFAATLVAEEGLVFVAARDVTDEKNAEAALRLSESRTRSIFEHSLGGLITTNERGVMESVNPAATQMFGYQPSEIIGRSVVMLIDDEYSSERECLRQLRDTALGRVTEWRGRRKNGEAFACELSLFEFYAGDDQRHFAAHMLDVSERTALDRMKKDFISTVSHELRTPLTSIRGSLGLLASGVMGDLGPDARQMVAVAERNSVRLIMLINDILDFEKLEQGKVELHRRPTPLVRALERSIETISALAVREAIEIELHCPEVNVLADETRLVQVVVNLLSNAVKYSRHGGTVTVRAAVEDGMAEVRVIDHGRGISEEAQKRLFERFHQVDASDSRRKPGTGLGLAICKAIIEQLGGRIGVESEEGKGSTFWFRLPTVADAQAEAAESHAPDVLLIEDDPALLEVMTAQLSASGIRVRTARTGWAALAAIQERLPGLLVLDVNLPDIDGYRVVSELRGRPSHRSLPLLVYTAADLNHQQRRDLQLGPTRFLMKSLATDAEFRGAVGQLLEYSIAGEIA